MKLSVRQDSIKPDAEARILLILALEEAATSWLGFAAKADEGSEPRKNMLERAGNAKALSILLAPKNEPDTEQAQGQDS